MHSQATKRYKSAGMFLAAALLSVAGVSNATAAPAFDALKGGWSGGGTASFASGETEKLRCTARYSGGESNLSLNLKCASASAQINLTGQLSANGNKVSGSWNETSFGQSGEAHGSMSGGTVRLRISGTQTGSLSLNVAGRRHTVSISTKGSSLQSVNVSMGRR